MSPVQGYLVNLSKSTIATAAAMALITVNSRPSPVFPFGHFHFKLPGELYTARDRRRQIMGGSGRNSHLHVVIIGAGVVGSSIAFNVSRR